MATLRNASSKEDVVPVEKVMAGPGTTVNGLSTEDLHFLETFDSKHEADIYKKVSKALVICAQNARLT